MTEAFENRQVRGNRFVQLQARRAEQPRTQHRPSRIAVVIFLLIGVLPVQGMEPAPGDPLSRMSPQSSVLQFLDACHSHEYAKAAHYLDLRQMSPADRSKNGPILAQQLEDLLDDTPFDIATLSPNPEGDLSDSISPSRQRLATFHLEGQTLELLLQRVELTSGLKVWLVSADSLPLIPKAHQFLTETPLEKMLPQSLVRHEFFGTPLWRWIALLAIGCVMWFVAGFASQVMAVSIGKLTKTNVRGLSGPIRVCFATAGFRAAMALAPPSALPRLYVERGLAMGFLLGLAWAATTAIDYVAEHWRSRLDPRVQAMTYSVLPLGRQVVKLCLFLVAILAGVSAWGYNTATILAGLGVGGIAVALAAQKTIENLFGGISVIGDRPVLVGDFCRFGTHMGSVLHIGLRSTRIRTLDRTILSVPNSQFSSVELENFSARDKIWFHVTLGLRRDTSSDQMLRVLSALRDILRQHATVEIGDIPVRFVGIGNYSLDVEVFAYVTTSDYDVFLGIQQELLLEILRAVERVGAALAVPLLESSHVQELATVSR